MPCLWGRFGRYYREKGALGGCGDRAESRGEAFDVFRARTRLESRCVEKLMLE